MEITTYDLRTPEAVFRESHDAFNRGDLDAFCALWAEDCEYRPAPEFSLEGPAAGYRGHEGLRVWWQRIHDDWDEVHSAIEQVRDLGDRCMGQIAFRGRGAASGAAIEAHVVQVATVREGRIAQTHDYFDLDQAAQIEGLPT